MCNTNSTRRPTLTLTNYYARIEPSTDGRLTKELVLYIGDSTIRIWPADADKIEQLANKLKVIADDLHETGYKDPIVAHMEESD